MSFDEVSDSIATYCQGRHKMKPAKLAGVLAAIFACSVTQASPVIYFGENLLAGYGVSGDPLIQRDAFLAALVGEGSDGFETRTPGSGAPFDVSLGGTTATLSGVGQIADNPVATSSGRFNTTPDGSKWWDVSGAFSIDFTTPISAFGFYGTDVGDFLGRLTIALTDANNVVTSRTVPNSIDHANQGALLFWGFIDGATTYKKVTFGNTGTGTDFFGFDDMVAGTPQQASVPEPATLALVGLGLLGLGIARRRAPRG
jgi:hypothetical protein